MLKEGRKVHSWTNQLPQCCQYKTSLSAYIFLKHLAEKTRFHPSSLWTWEHEDVSSRKLCLPQSFIQVKQKEWKVKAQCNPEDHCVQQWKRTAQQHLLKLPSKTGSTWVSPLYNLFTYRDVSTPCLAIALLHLYLCPRNWIFLEWHMNELRLLMWLYQTNQQGLPINRPPVLWKLKKNIEGMDLQAQHINHLHHSSPTPKPLC